MGRGWEGGGEHKHCNAKDDNNESIHTLYYGLYSLFAATKEGGGGSNINELMPLYGSRGYRKAYSYCLHCTCLKHNAGIN